MAECNRAVILTGMLGGCPADQCFLCSSEPLVTLNHNTAPKTQTVSGLNQLSGGVAVIEVASAPAELSLLVLFTDGPDKTPVNI